ncbi:MAG: mitochondrial fission ELM1 family protein [Bdellovibrionales bacterium]
MQDGDEKNLMCWVVSEGMAGTENQCIAVAEALGVAFDEIKRIALRQPWKSLSPYIGLEQVWSFSPALSAPWPDLVIAAGRKSIAASRYIKRRHPATFTVQIQDPRVDPAQFDLVAVPHHDPTRGKNVVVTDASPNRITAEKLAAARSEFPQFEMIKPPRVAVLIGGTSKAYRMDTDIMRGLAQALAGLDAGLMVTPSRRTGAENEGILQAALPPDAYIWDGDGSNPYFGMLAWADTILVTADSASMLSDACSTGKPVYMIPLKGGHPRIDKLHAHLQNLGALRVWDGRLDAFSYAPLNDAAKVANAIRDTLEL